MNTFNDLMPVLTLLATMITILVGAQAINKSIRETGFFKSIFSFVMIFAPILFIQLVVKFITYFYEQCIIMALIVMGGRIVFVFFATRSLSETFSHNCRLTALVAILILSICFYSYNGYIMFATSDFVEKLTEQKINYAMFQYLYENFSATIYYILMLIQFFYLLICTINLLSEEFGDKGTFIKMRNQPQYLFVCGMLSLPFTYELIQYIINMFG